jgi:hypothetical protein
MFEIHEAVERVSIKGSIEIEQVSSFKFYKHKINLKQLND